MNQNQVVRQEAVRLARGLIALMLVVGGLLVLAGQGSVQMVASLLAGTLFAWVLFVVMACNVAKSIMQPPARAAGYIRRGYAFRYIVTGIYVFFAMTLPVAHTFAAVLPLFFPKILLLTHSIFSKKGGK